MNWIDLTSENQLKDIIASSYDRPQIIFKHSTRCSVSSIAFSRLKKSGPITNGDFFYLDLLSYRQLSNKIAELFKVPHESPQILLIKNGECIYEESHLGITADDLQEQLIVA
ncbi:MAG: bacillithiol system redox-active protein YtxJ [Chitinophagaceae bacterium]|nr:bacillithiol system redox-active protein YtxJ [Chitinophagaceae bacterium]